MKIDTNNKRVINHSTTDNTPVSNGGLLKELLSYIKDGISCGALSVTECIAICEDSGTNSRKAMRNTLKAQVIESKGTLAMLSISVPKGKSLENGYLLCNASKVKETIEHLRKNVSGFKFRNYLRVDTGKKEIRTKGTLWSKESFVNPVKSAFPDFKVIQD